MYVQNPWWSWENEVSGAAAGILAMAVIFALAVVVTIVGIMLTEIWRVYETRAIRQPNSPSARVLWIALMLFLGVLILAGFLVTTAPLLAAWALPMVTWSFLIYVIVVEFTDYYASHEVRTLAGQEEGVAGSTPKP